MNVVGIGMLIHLYESMAAAFLMFLLPSGYITCV